MKVTQVAIRPTEASEKAQRPALTPELLAASGARYSRSNEGLDAILARIDPANLDKSVDAIFRMIDYGHQSIADMAPVALFIDGISLYLAYYVWTLCPVAGGQESSTRYIRMSEDGLVSPDALGIPKDTLERDLWHTLMAQSFAAYHEALDFWECIVAENPDVARIPRALQNDPAPKAQRAAQRMARNYAFDRARYFLPVAAQTNVMLVMSARAWVTLCQYLLSHPLLEARTFGEAVREELGLSAPRLLRHARPQESLKNGLLRELHATRVLSSRLTSEFVRTTEVLSLDHAPTATLEVFLPPYTTGEELKNDLEFHDNRYAYLGETLRRTSVRFGWEAVAFAEIRDLNRHRTGTKYCPPVPVGFYHAADEIPADHAGASPYRLLGGIGREVSLRGRIKLDEGDPLHVYYALLGTQFPFEQTTTADKFLYEAELRTGTGAHYRYARHLRETLALWYDRFPATRGLVLEGSAEPE